MASTKLPNKLQSWIKYYEDICGFTGDKMARLGKLDSFLLILQILI